MSAEPTFLIPSPGGSYKRNAGGGVPYECKMLCSSKMSCRVMDSKKSSTILSSLSHMGRVLQQALREQAEGPWVVQETVARPPSVSFKILPMVYSLSLIHI